MTHLARLLLLLTAIAAGAAPAWGQTSVWRGGNVPADIVNEGAGTADAGVMEGVVEELYEHALQHAATRADVTATTVPAGTDHIRTAGYAAAGDGGGGLYERAASEPPHDGKLQSADGAWWELVAEDGEIRARQFGAAEGGDVTGAVQDAIDFAGYGATSTPGTAVSRPAEVLIDVRRGTLSDTIQVGYGLDFQSLRVRGLGQAYTGSDHHTGTVLTSTATDRPAFAISGGRDSAIMDLTIVGAADAEMEAIGRTGRSPTLEATWETALDDAGITRGQYTPYAAIAIDPYAGAAPGTAYPSVSYPSWIESSVSQYGKQRTTAPRIERVTIRGFEVGIAQTPADVSSNGDFPVMRSVRLDGLKYGFSTGNSQGRIPYFDACQFADIWTVYADNVHGQQTGNSNAEFHACGFGGFIGNLFSLGSLARGGMTFRNCDVESLHRIGDIASGATQQVGIWFRDSSINFRHSDTNGHPPNVLDANGSRGVVGFDGGDIRVFSVASFLDARVRVINGTMINFDDTSGSRAKAYGQIASNALAGGIVVGPNDVVPEFDAVFAAYDLDTNTSDGALLLGPETRKTTQAHGPAVVGGGAAGRDCLHQAAARDAGTADPLRPA